MRAAEAHTSMRALPVRAVAALVAAGPLVILAPHPDDESLGCGGIIAACCTAGMPPFVVVITDGAGSHPNSIVYPPGRLVALRQAEARAAVAWLGLPADRIGFLGLPDTRSPLEGSGLEEASERVVKVVRRVGAGAVLATWASDPHCDHLSAHRIGARAAAVCGVRHLAYPVWGWTLPDDAEVEAVHGGMQVDVSALLTVKRHAILAHRSQYAGVIPDDPAGFQMSEGFMEMFLGSHEVVLEV